MEQKIKALGKLLTSLYWAIGDILNRTPQTSVLPSVWVGKKTHKILCMWLWTSGWVHIPAKEQEKTKKPRYSWVINPDEGWIRHNPHIKVWINEYCTMQARSCSSGAQVYFDIHWGETRRHTAHREWNQEHNSCRFPCDTSQLSSSVMSICSLKTANVSGLFLGIPAFPGPFAWMWGVSVHQQQGRALSLCQRWNCVTADEWAFPQKELQAVSYFELRDPFIFWLFLLLTLISSADISTAHGTWWHFLKCFFFTN